MLTRGCTRGVSVYPRFCSPLHVAVQSSGKLRLVLDLSYLNKFIFKKSVKYEVLKTVLQMFFPGMLLSFHLILSQPIITLKSARSTGNSCPLNGLIYPDVVTKFYEF